MNESRVEALLRNETVPGLPEEVRLAHKQALRAAIAADPATTPAPAPDRRRWWRRGGITLLAGGLVLAGAGAATAFLTRAQPEDPEIVRCFTVAAPPFTSGAPGSYDASYGPGDGTLDKSAALAIELCGYGWAEGRLPSPESHTPRLHQSRTPAGARTAGLHPARRHRRGVPRRRTHLHQTRPARISGLSRAADSLTRSHGLVESWPGSCQGCVGGGGRRGRCGAGGAR